ncbi:MAG: YbjN domain-containing protein [Sphingopyxis sp.]|uniref:YbjN domain-containing protein n=1 Tax=Sphingopyxis sp. TaxID=1908224 RepID=UPI002AB835C0|nr:YbjN domain-containing protein [Sphingopyxis sp.]MDZ3830952.1 YbjN domain-containing protein [Sphingopyxis sp.]
MRDFAFGTFVAASAAALFAATPAQAELVNATNPDTIKKIIESRGWPATLVSKDGDDPYIESNRDGLKFLVLFMNCTENKNCKTLQYYMGFSDAKDVNLERLNQWNKEKRFARAYRDGDGDPVLEMDVDLDFAGLPRENVGESFNTWASLMDSYREFIFEK